MPPRRLSAFIREHQADIIEQWERVVRKLPIARDLDRPALIDHIPALLEGIAHMADELAAGDKPQLPSELSQVHALERLDEGFDLSQVVSEFAILRDSIVERWAAHSAADRDDAFAIRALNQAIDRAVGSSVQRYTLARDRTLQALDQISVAAFETQNLDEFLARLLRVLQETTAAVDTATILLRDGDLLRVRATVGLELEAESRFAVRVGEGLAGMVAKTRTPQLVHSAATDPQVLGPWMRGKGVKALFGVPLIDGSDVIGVAHMGSVTANDFSLQDRRLFVAMANRATSAIFQHLLRDASVRRAQEQQAVAKLGLRALSANDVAALAREAVHSVKETLGVEFASALDLLGDGHFGVVAEDGWGPEIARKLRIGSGTESQSGFTLRHGEPVIVADVATETRFEIPAVVREKGIQSGISVVIPLPGQGDRKFGVLAAHTRRRGGFDPDDVSFMQAVAHVLGTAIALRQSEDARLELLGQERARRAELEAVIESIPDAVFIGTARGITRCNAAALDLVGSDSVEDLQQPLEDLARRLISRDPQTGALIEPEDTPFVRALTGETAMREVRLRNLKSGRELVVRTSAAPIRQGDAVIGAVSVSADITAESRAREAVARALEQQRLARVEAERILAVLDTVLSASALGIAFIDVDLRYVRINDALAAINGPSPAEHIGRTVRDVLGEQASLLEPQLARVLATREAISNLELEVAPPATPDQIRSFLANFVPVVTAHGELLGVGAVVVEITERKRIETALRQRELELRTLADNVPQLAWMADETGSIIWYNERWYAYTNTTAEEMASGWQKVQHPDHVDRVVAKFREHIASGEVWEDTFPMRGRDGNYRWFLSRAVPVRDERGNIVRWFGTNTDVTEQRFMAEATRLLSTSLDYRETLEKIARLAVPALGDWCAVDLLEEQSITRVAVAHTAPAKVQLAYEWARKYPADPTAHHGIANVIRTGKPELMLDVSEELLVERARDPEHLELIRQLGLKSYVVVPLVARGRTLGAVTLASAESGRRYDEAHLAIAEELGRRAGLAVDNARLFEEAQRAARMREEILAVVSHDLKNPLGAIHLAATLLLDRPDPKSRKPLETIHRAASRMDHMIGDLLDVASIQAGRLAIEAGPEDPELLVREAIDLHESMATKKGITIVRSDRLQGTKLSIDRERVIQVFGNLIGNALKFCRAGDTITIQGERADEMACFAVVDTGPGIPEAELPHIFEPYWSGKRHARKGTGLGLFISKGIVEAHGGRIWVESTVSEGTKFFFTLPFA